MISKEFSAYLDGREALFLSSDVNEQCVVFRIAESVDMFMPFATFFMSPKQADAAVALLTSEAARCRAWHAAQKGAAA